MSVPLSKGISGEVLLNEIPSLMDVKFSFPEEPFMVWLLYNRELGDSSPHKTFLDSLPSRYVQPLTFTNEEWGQLAVDFTSLRMNKIVNADREILARTKASLIKDMKENGANEVVAMLDKVTFEDYIWAYVAIKDLLKYTPSGTYIFPAIKFAHSNNAVCF